MKTAIKHEAIVMEGKGYKGGQEWSIVVESESEMVGVKG